jgi:hypothetical protein
MTISKTFHNSAEAVSAPLAHSADIYDHAHARKSDWSLDAQRSGAVRLCTLFFDRALAA